MKKVLGILFLVCVCIALGLSVKWFREQNTSLVVTIDNTDTRLNM